MKNAKEILNDLIVDLHRKTGDRVIVMKHASASDYLVERSKYSLKYADTIPQNEESMINEIVFVSQWAFRQR